MRFHIKNFKKNLFLLFVDTILVTILVIFTSKINFNNQIVDTSVLVLKEGLIFNNDQSFPFTGKLLDTLDNKMIVECDIVNGLMEGIYILASSNGELAAFGSMEKNKNEGTWQYYYENGQLRCQGDFDDDCAIGKWIWYYENGIKKCEGTFLKGLPEGKWIKYDERGYPSLLINYSAGEIIYSSEIEKPISI